MPIQPKQQPPYYQAQTEIKQYKALLTQSGTAAPTANILINTLGATPVWTYTSQGSYKITLANAFTIGKTAIQISPTGGIVGIGFNGTDPDYLDINTTDNSAAPQNDYLYETEIQILIYP